MSAFVSATPNPDNYRDKVSGFAHGSILPWFPGRAGPIARHQNAGSSAPYMTLVICPDGKQLRCDRYLLASQGVTASIVI